MGCSPEQKLLFTPFYSLVKVSLCSGGIEILTDMDEYTIKFQKRKLTISKQNSG